MPYPSTDPNQDDTESLPYSTWGDPSDPFNQLSSARALAMSPNGMRMPPMPASQRASQLASQVTDDSGGVWSAMPGETPDVAKDVQPAGWRTALGLAAQWFTRRHPGLGAAAANAITSTDPRVKAHQELLNQYGIANQQAQAERQNLGTMGQFGYRNAMLDNTRARLAETQQRDRQAAEDREAKAYDYQTGPRQAKPISPIPPVAPLAPQPGAQLPQVTFPTLDASARLGQNAPPTVTPGASQIPPAIGTVPTPGMNIAGEQLSQARNPYTRQVETLSGPTQETLNAQKTEQAIKAKTGEPLGDRATVMNQLMERRWQVLHPAQPLPPEYSVSPNSTEKEYADIDNALKATESATATKAQQDSVLELRKQTLALAQQKGAEKTDTALKQGTYKAYAPALDSAERFNVMSKNYEEAIKNHDQQAMLSLLANHLGMTMGLQKGARLNQAIIQEAEKARPWLQGMQSKFDKDGYLSGVTLTPEQMRQMVSLGRERFAEDLTKARNQAGYLGATDDGPKRTPNKATVRFYRAQAGGDMDKAKQLAAADGWNIE